VSEAVARKTPSRPPSDRSELYELARKLSTEVSAVVALVASAERFFLRDQLDRKSASLPLLVKGAMACDSLVERRAVYVKARRVTQDCLAVLDELDGQVEQVTLLTARVTATALIEALGPLTVPPPLAR
jgi:hypothetical protein